MSCVRLISVTPLQLYSPHAWCASAGSRGIMPPMHKRIAVVFLGIALLAGAAFAAEPALPRKGGAPVVYQCPLTNLVVNGETKLFPLRMQSARGDGKGLVCNYTVAAPVQVPIPKGLRACPASLNSVSV